MILDDLGEQVSSRAEVETRRSAPTGNPRGAHAASRTGQEPEITKVVVAMSMSLDGIAGPESADADGMAIFAAILGWQFPLRSWRQEQGMDGGEDSVDSRVWADNFAGFSPQVIGRTMFDYGYPNWGENPPFHAPVFVVTHRGQERISKSGGTSYMFVTGGCRRRGGAGAGGSRREGRPAGGRGQHRPGGAGRRAGRRGGVACRAEAGGAGRWLFGAGEVDLRCTETIQGEGAVHLPYEVQ